MSQSISKSLRTTEDEYLRMEEAAKTRHEFRDGEIIDMAGASLAHIEISSNLVRKISLRLKGKPCKTLGSDLKVRIDQSGSYYYPDVTVVCGPVESFRPDQKSIVTNPRLIIEVMSPSTEFDDRGRKFTDYRTLNSLEEYVLVSQERMEVETYYRQPDGIWAIGPSFTAANKSVALRSLEIEIPMAEIYAGIEFIPSPPKEPPPPES